MFYCGGVKSPCSWIILLLFFLWALVAQTDPIMAPGTSAAAGAGSSWLRLQGYSSDCRSSVNEMGPKMNLP